MYWRFCFLFPVFLFSPGVRDAGAADIPSSLRYRVDVLAKGLSQPMHLVPLPDGRVIFSELNGLVRVYLPATGSVETVGSVEVTMENENGLLGMCLDPDFETNGWMYLLHSPRDYPGQILSRFTLEQLRLNPATRKDLLRWEEQRQECCHHAGTLRFGPDGLLYISTGDNTHPFGDSDSYAPLDERPGRGPWDAQKSSANTNDLRGKILRIRPTAEGSYSIPPGNLFPPGTPRTRPEIYAMGLRNPWRFQIDAASGVLYSGDVGPDAGGPSRERGPQGYDVIYRIQRAANLGWPYVRGGQAYRDFDFASKTPGEAFDPQRPVNRSPNSQGAEVLPPVMEPMLRYTNAADPGLPLLGSGGRTACAGPVFHFEESFRETGGLPQEYDHCLLIYDWQRPFLLWARMEADGRFKELLPFPDVVHTAHGAMEPGGRFQIKRPVDMAFGKDGSLYLLDYGETWGANADAQLIRIHYQWGNLAPIARAGVTPTAGRGPLPLKLTSTGTVDPEGEALAYEWRLQPGNRLLATTAQAEAVLTEEGAHVVELRVRDSQGGSSVAGVPVTVGNDPPAVVFDSPRDGDFYTPGQPLKWKVSVRDTEDGVDSKDPAAFAARTLVSTHWLRRGRKELPAGLTLMKQSDCFNCHAVEQKLVGPSLLEIAERYRGQAGAETQSVVRVRDGSANVWSPVPMLAHPQHSVDELHLMVRYILDLEAGKVTPGMVRALSGESMAPEDPEISSAILEAVYADTGHGSIPVLSGKADITLRSRRIQAEAAETLQGPVTLEFANAGGRQAIGAIGHQHFLTLRSIPLGQCRSISCRAASAGTGGTIEIRTNHPGGNLLAVLTVPPTDGWDVWKEFRAALPSTAQERSDVCLVFVQPGTGNGIMNLDWVEFDP